MIIGEIRLTVKRMVGMLHTSRELLTGSREMVLVKIIGRYLKHGGSCADQSNWACVSLND